MSPKNISNILDLAVKARKQNKTFVPLFAGDAGLGKSQVCQQWAKTQQQKDSNFGFIDLRIALMEAPDFIGKPVETTDDTGKPRTSYALPAFWPTSGEGLLLLEEPNRGKSDVMNALMQLLTDRKVHDYQLPDGWIIAACINPDDGNYDVNSMDAAFVNRFVSYDVKYDKKIFVDYVEKNEWHPNIRMFVKNIFEFISIKDVSPGSKYISPRTLEQVNTVELCGISGNKESHFETVSAILGDALGKAYHSMIFDDTPLQYKDFVKNRQQAMDKLKRHSDPTNYRGDMLQITTQSVSDNYTEIEDELMAEILITLPMDVAATTVLTILNKFTMTNSSDSVQDLEKRVRNYLLGLYKFQPKLKEAIVHGKNR